MQPTVSPPLARRTSFPAVLCLLICALLCVLLLLPRYLFSLLSRAASFARCVALRAFFPCVHAPILARLVSAQSYGLMFFFEGANPVAFLCTHMSTHTRTHTRSSRVHARRKTCDPRDFSRAEPGDLIAERDIYGDITI